MEFLSIFLSIGLTSAFLQVFVEKLANYCIKKIGKTRKLHDNLQKLARTLLKIQSLIDDVENKHSISNACRILIEEFRSVVLDADDLLDEIAAEETKSSKSIESKVADMLKRVQELAAEVEVYFISEISKRRPRQALAIPHGSSLVDESFVVGRKDEKEKLINWLVADNTKPNSHQDVSVSSIVGMGGTGKTTLAQLVYNDSTVAEKFPLRMWVCVSLDYDLVKITKSILESANKKVSELSDLDSIQIQLEKVINTKFLLVLDDMWNENPVDWDALKLLFRFAGSGSKVVVTTRSKIVSSIVTTTPSNIHILNAMPTEDCEGIIKKILRPSIAEPGNLTEMAAKCKGLPLAAKVVGNALRFKSQEEWDALLKFDFWNLAEDKNYIYPVLKLSYDHLPAYLKRCFAYCSIFPLGHQFQVDDLIQLWAAEGFIQAQGTRRIEDIGRDYFHELFASSFFEISENGSGERVYKMHDFIHYLARLVSTNLCFRSEENILWPISRTVRHWSLPHQNVRKETWEEFQRYDKLRTFILLSETPSNLVEVPVKFFEKMRCLRVLNLSNSGISSLSDDFAKLIHLRYLNLSGNAFKKLPESIANIHGLDTLKLNDCPQLLELPENLMKLIKLRHFSFERCPKITSMPKDVGRLTSLQTVDVFIAGRTTGYRIEELKNMKFLGAVGIKKLENVENRRSAMAAELENKQYLNKLELLWTEGDRGANIEREVLGGLKPHDGLKKLKVKGYCGKEFPEWIGGPAPSVCKLVSLCIHSCSKLDTLPSFDRLTLLKVLEIGNCPDLRSLPAELPRSLESLKIWGSKALEDSCKRSSGADWNRIEWIPTIEIEGQKIQTP
ncbi:putative disease resistance RPP13-like protein 1 [Rosa rugosa]|uniref:putative disease resistance RPP13-like protein 1 n=1 Tax=Rosa rugosa TaxID=74645 RepID=UPI002B40268B|nr:putative disease resistance RPP13-like protein 1 [Rosa rugosa]